MTPAEARVLGSRRIAELTPEAKAFASDAISKRVVEQLSMLPTDAMGGRGVALYRALASEVDLRGVEVFCRAKGIPIFFPAIESNGSEILWREPRVKESQWEVHGLGITQPSSSEAWVDPARIQILLVPGRAFSVQGVRVGRGKGHYDRAMLTLSEGVPKWGVAFDVQVFPHIEKAEWDLEIETLFTETRCLSVNHSRPSPRRL